MSTNHTIPCMVCSPDKKPGTGTEVTVIENAFAKVSAAGAATNLGFLGLAVLAAVFVIWLARASFRRDRDTRRAIGAGEAALAARKAATNVLRSST